MHTMNAIVPFKQRQMNNYAPASLSLHNLEYYSIYSKWPISGETKKIIATGENILDKGENQQQTQSTNGAALGIRTRVTFVGGMCSHH